MSKINTRLVMVSFAIMISSSVILAQYSMYCGWGYRGWCQLSRTYKLVNNIPGYHPNLTAWTTCYDNAGDQLDCTIWGRDYGENVDRLLDDDGGTGYYASYNWQSIGNPQYQTPNFRIKPYNQDASNPEWLKKYIVFNGTGDVLYRGDRVLIGAGQEIFYYSNDDAGNTKFRIKATLSSSTLDYCMEVIPYNASYDDPNTVGNTCFYNTNGTVYDDNSGAWLNPRLSARLSLNQESRDVQVYYSGKPVYNNGIQIYAFAWVTGGN
jgi:hypothetical protein